MEVHHHSHHPKKWKEYVTEFIMLFAAVTLGFFAENYREHQIIDHRMEENYQALIEDLKQDSASIQQMLLNNIEEKKGMILLLNALYKYHDHSIDPMGLQNEVLKIERFPSNVTLFMNNTTFKNMQSSGMLSYVNDKELRTQLSYYYEVLFKKLIDNNSLYDQDSKDFYSEHFPLIQPTINRYIDSILNTNDQASLPYRTIEENKSFIYKLDFSNKLLQNPKTLLNVEGFYLRFNVYKYLIISIQEQNIKLMKLLYELKNV